MTDAQVLLLLLNAWMMVAVSVQQPLKSRTALYNASFYLLIWLWMVLM